MGIAVAKEPKTHLPGSKIDALNGGELADVLFDGFEAVKVSEEARRGEIQNWDFLVWAPQQNQYEQCQKLTYTPQCKGCS